MKKILSLALAVCMLFAIAACSPKKDDPAPATQAQTETKTAEQPPAQPPAPEPVPAAVAEQPAPAPVAEAVGPAGLPAYTGEPTELRFEWWGNDERAAMTKKVIAVFMELYPTIKIVGQPNGGTSDHFTIVDTEIQGNNGPDLIQFGGNYPDYIKYLEPMTPYLGKELTINDPEKFDQTALIPATRDGQLWVASLGTNTLVLAYNKTMIEGAGAALPKDNMTWDELMAYGRELKAKLPDGVYPFVDNGTNQANYMSYFFQQEGTPLWTTDTDGEDKSFATEATALKWMKLWADMRAEGLISDADTTATYGETGADNSALVAGKAAIGMLWSNQVAGYQGAMTDSLSVTTLPAGGQKAYAIQMSQYIGVYNASKNKEAAMLFANFITTSPIAGALLGTNRGVPCSPQVRQAIANSTSELDSSVYHLYDVIADRTIPQGPNLPNDQEFVNELQLIGQSVAYGQTSVDQSAKDVMALITRLAVK